MKKKIFVFLFIFLLFLSPLLSQENKLKVLAERANIYLDPYINSSIIERIEKGAILNLLSTGKIRKIWYYVSFYSEKRFIPVAGFIQASLVEIIYETPKIIEEEKREPTEKIEEILYKSPNKIKVISNIFREEIDKSKIPRLRWMSPGIPGTYEEYTASFPIWPFFIKEIIVSPYYKKYIRPEPPKIFVIVNSSVYSEVSTEISLYVDMLKYCGYNVELYESFGGIPEDLKSFIMNKKDDLIGCIFIGSLPAAWYEVANDYDEYGYAEFPWDLFFMDLDGEWIDSDFNGRYDSHSDGSGDREPEIFVVRIDVSQMAGNEYEILKQYFYKNCNYWSGKINLLKHGLTYTEDDWEPYDYFKRDISLDIDKLYDDSAKANAIRISSQDNIRVMTYNIRTGAGVDPAYPDGYRLPRILEIIKAANPDILAIQEANSWDKGDPPVVQQVAEELDMNYFLGCPFGAAVALFTKFEIIEAEDYPGHFSRGALRAELIDPNGESIHVFNVHLWPETGAYRRVELTFLVGEIAPYLNKATILMGDMNFPDPDLYTKPGLHSMLYEAGWCHPFVYQHHIDHIWVPPTLAPHVQPRVYLPHELTSEASDHLPVIHDIKIYYPASENEIYPPENFRLQRLENNFIFFIEHIDSLTWEANPKNGTKVVRYNLYRKLKGTSDCGYELVTGLDANIFNFDHRGLKEFPPPIYTYKITSVDEYDRESEPLEVSHKGE